MRGGGEYDASITAQGKMGPATITLPCLCVCPIAWERGSLCVCVGGGVRVAEYVFLDEAG